MRMLTGIQGDGASSGKAVISNASSNQKDTQ